MPPKKPVLRLTRPDDINKLVQLDLKCYHYPMKLEEWQKRVKGSGKENEARVLVAEVASTAIAFAMWTTDTVDSTTLLRLGVLPQYRRMGLGTVMMKSCVKHAHDNQSDKVRVVVPHIHCCPGDADDVSGFLNHCGFKATGEIVDDWKTMYGKMVEAYVFERGVL